METTQESVCNLTTLLKAEQRCHRNVGYKNSVSNFHRKRLTRCYELHKELMNGTYRTSEGHDMFITRPKKRVVTSIRYRDRIPQSSFIINYFYPNVVPNLIDNNMACLKGKGVDLARNTFKEILRYADENNYCLKLDLKNYFGSIDRKKLIEELCCYINDEWARYYYADVINSNKGEVGIGLGSEINQLSAVTFTNKIDHKFDGGTYIKYQDDFIFVGTKQECYLVKDLLIKELEELNLTISKKKTYIQKISKPISFLGFTFLKHKSGKIILKRKRDKLKTEKRTLKRMKNKNVPIEKVKEHYQSVRATMKKGSRSGVVKLDRYFNKLFQEENL